MIRNHTRALVTTHWLKGRLSRLGNDNDRTLRILDTSWKPDKVFSGYEECYKKAHIPHSSFFDLHQCVSSTPTIPRNIPHTHCFTEYVRGLGIHKDSHVIVYDGLNRWPSVRSWWLFRFFGHDKISILDGGLTKWLNDGYPTTTKEPHFQESEWVASPQKDLIRDMSDMLINQNSDREQVVDARREAKFTGEECDEGIAPGHIPEAINVPYLSLFNQDFTFKSSNELDKIFDDAGVNIDRPMVAMCRTGVTACGLAVAAHILGIDRVPIYYGSWWEWGQVADKNLRATGKTTGPYT